MPRITDIKLQKRKKDRFNVYLDGKFAFGLFSEALTKAGLKVEMEISEEKVKKLIGEDDYQKIFDRALNFLSYRPRSEKEVCDWFRKKEVGEKTQKLVLVKLKSLGFLNDEEFAHWFIEQRISFNPKGKRLIALELKQKGVSGQIIEQGFEDSGLTASKMSDLARGIVQKKLKVSKGLSKQKLRGRLTSSLARRGFDWETIKEVLSSLNGA